MTLGSFEREFQAFLSGGGFSRPCPSEHWERTQRGSGRVMEQVQYEKCKHGLTYLTCSHCYFQFQPRQEEDGA